MTRMMNVYGYGVGGLMRDWFGARVVNMNDGWDRLKFWHHSTAIHCAAMPMYSRRNAVLLTGKVVTWTLKR
jgi:hypothetical protein